MTALLSERPVIPLHSFTTRQISESTLVPLSKVYALKKQLTEGLHFVEIRSTSNTKQISFSPSGLTAIEISHWLLIGRKSAWSVPRLEAFTRASKWLEVAA